MSSIEIMQQPRLVPQLAERLRVIYRDSFPPHEREEFSFLVDSIAAGERWLFTAMRNDVLLGFAIIIPNITRDVHLLEYLAVARHALSAGIGGILLRHLVDAARVTGDIAGIMLEVEHDEEGGPEERVLRQRRIAFYTRHGAQLVDGVPNYRVPLADRAGTMRMKLLWLPIDGADIPRGNKLRECVEGIFEKSYGLSTEDVFGREILAGIG